MASSSRWLWHFSISAPSWCGKLWSGLVKLATLARSLWLALIILINLFSRKVFQVTDLLLNSQTIKDTLILLSKYPVRQQEFIWMRWNWVAFVSGQWHRQWQRKGYISGSVCLHLTSVWRCQKCCRFVSWYLFPGSFLAWMMHSPAPRPHLKNLLYVGWYRAGQGIMAAWHQPSWESRHSGSQLAWLKVMSSIADNTKW